MVDRTRNSDSHPLNPGARRRRVLYLLLSFFIPFLLMVVGLEALHVDPFGQHTLAVSDGKFYLNTELFFGRLLKGQENFLYSFDNGLGGNEWSHLSWGGFSLGGLLSFFATLETIPILFTWICTVNMAFCGLTMYLFLAGLHGHRFSNLIFSTSYALMGFSVVNCFQALFFIGPQLLPLMALGLVKLVRRQSPLLYILSLAVCIFFNFYFGFHLCVASVLFFLTFLYVRHGELKGKVRGLFGTWAASSVIAGLLAAPMWLPALKAFSGGGRLAQTGLEEYTFRENMPFLQIFSKLFSGANSTDEMINGLPNIFCGVLTVALMILYFMDREIDPRRRRAAAGVLGFYLLTFYLPALTLLMHGGTHTNWFPYRYSYIFSFLLIGLAAREFQHLDALTFRDAKKCGAALLIGTVLVFSTSYEFVSGGAVVLDLALLLLMWLGCRLHRDRPNKMTGRALSAFLLLMVSVNLLGNYVLSIPKMWDWELDIERYNYNILVSGAMIDAIHRNDTGVFRMEREDSASGTAGMDPYLFNYSGVSHSGPAERSFIHNNLCRLGINWYDMRHWYSRGVPAATDALLGLKYLISDRDLAAEKGYELRTTANETGIYQSPYYLSPSILANTACIDVKLGSDAFDNLNRVWRAMTGGKRDIFTEQRDVTFTLHNSTADHTVTSAELRDDAADKNTADNDGDSRTETYIEYSFIATRDGPIYVFDASVPDSELGSTVPIIKFCGVYLAGDTVTGTFDVSGTDYLTDALFRDVCANQVFASADNGVLAEYAEALNRRDCTFNVLHENDLTGTFTAEEGRRILFTIPWDEGWTCTIDGEKVSIDKTWDLFMSVEAPAGSHTYEMKFFPAWMNYGLILSGAALAGLAALLMVLRRKEDPKPAAEDEP